jgi:hypothetical protein
MIPFHFRPVSTDGNLGDDSLPRVHLVNPDLRHRRHGIDQPFIDRIFGFSRRALTP